MISRNQSSTLFGLAPNGVYLAAQVTLNAGALLPHRFTLATRMDTPVAEATSDQPFGGLLSAALSLISQSVDVIDHPVLWSPDFPPVIQDLEDLDYQRSPHPLATN